MDTRSKLLSSARDQIQRKGYNGFSYADLANEIGIRKASIHHHFSTKADLGREVAIEYRHDFMAALRTIESRKTSNVKKLEAYIQLFRHTLEKDHKVCLCAMLAADHDSLSDLIKMEVKTFFDENETWLTQLLERGQENNEFTLMSSPGETAKLILSALEGAMIIAESMKDTNRLESISQWILSTIKKT